MLSRAKQDNIYICPLSTRCSTTYLHLGLPPVALVSQTDAIAAVGAAAPGQHDVTPYVYKYKYRYKHKYRATPRSDMMTDTTSYLHLRAPGSFARWHRFCAVACSDCVVVGARGTTMCVPCCGAAASSSR